MGTTKPQDGRVSPDRNRTSMSPERQAGSQAGRISRYRHSDDPHVQHAMKSIGEGDHAKGLAQILDDISEKRTARGDAALIESVIGLVDSQDAGVRRSAMRCVMGLVIKSNKALAKALVEMCSDPGTTKQRIVRLQALARCDIC